ncbi:hypothetical protein [Streptomyces sp. KLOTTS4A1]|uniref:hypothetical protein n=1 Tax=Streptomyces sp. KLOTTS4A1 TaxID=3390996 RepID=UPI0039F5D715
MAHAAPRPTGFRTSAFGGRAALLTPVLALVYGYWAAANHRSGGPITAGDVWLGIISTIAFAVVYLGLLKLAPRLKRELRAIAWASFVGIAFGWLYSLTDASVLRSIIMSVSVATVLGAAVFYRFYTTEDGEGHRTHPGSGTTHPGSGTASPAS